jgi:hypothetical protein
VEDVGHESADAMIPEIRISRSKALGRSYPASANYPLKS